MMQIREKSPLVSVIIPNYNHERFLTERIRSVLDQTFRDFEVIILDDHSSDNSREVIEKYRGHELVSKIVYNTANSGTTFKQWKKGIGLAAGKYIWLAESDDAASPEFLSTLIQPFFLHPDLVISYCRSVNVDENSNSLGISLHADQLDALRWTKDYVEDGDAEVRHYLKYRNTIPNASAVLFRKPANLDGLLKTDMRYCGDWLFWQSLLKVPAAKISYSHKTLNFFRTHPATTRNITVSVHAADELRRFREYRRFVPALFLNPFDDRFRWMMAEWIDRRLSTSLKNSRYYYIPLLHPALVIRYYFYLLKKFIVKRLAGLKAGEDTAQC